MALNYFTCTLGQAFLRRKEIDNAGNSSQTVNDLIDYQAEVNSTKPAAAFAYPALVGITGLPDKQFHKLYTFEEIRNGSHHVSNLIRDKVSESQNQQDDSRGQSVALLCPSTPEFLFTWLGLIRLGYSVLLVAPQCQPDAIVHLCKVCRVSLLLYDSLNQGLACKTAETSGEVLRSMPLGFSTDDHDFISALARDPGASHEGKGTDSFQVAYLHHTSGTSSGLPKPIAQTHHAAVGVLPYFEEGHANATFTTTPLYHGGIADLFRAWTSSTLIWLFPGKSPGHSGSAIQISASNVLSCLKIAKEQSHFPCVKYFSSVPYVLQMLASLPEGLVFLKAMDCVGVGGAALPVEIGDELVSNGVNLLSRFGSAECGFLASSHRNYRADKEWQYLRFDNSKDLLEFRTRDDGKHELIVLEHWPHRSVQGLRSNDPFPTSDLFVPHHSIPNAWRYDSRADSQLTLITGKKFDPAPLEDAISVSSLLEDVLIFGNGRPFPGALLLRSTNAANVSDEDLIAEIAPQVEDLNSKSQTHARIPRNMLVPAPAESPKLEKSSKGTVLRKSAEATYLTLIETAYTRLDSNIFDTVPDELVAGKIQEAVKTISGHDVGIDEDLYSHGVDSLGSIQLRHTLQRLLPKDADKLPMTVVEDSGTIERLATLVIKRRAGSIKDEADDGIQLMHSLVEQYGNFSALPPTPPQKSETAVTPDDREVVLTGATGGLGAQLLNQYRSSPNVSHIYCLVRGASVHAATERVNKSLSSRCLPDLNTPLDNADRQRRPAATVLPCTLSSPTLGLSPEIYTTLAERTTLFIHAAWTVNFRLRLRSFVDDHIAGTRHLLDLFLTGSGDPGRTSRCRIIFCSSTASVIAQPSPPSSSPSTLISETPSLNPNDASPLGYSRSKHVAESLLRRLVEQHPSLHDDVAIARIGQLSGDTVHGVWNASEAWPLMLGSVRAMGSLPDLGSGAKLDWLGVDVAARAVGEVAASMGASAYEDYAVGMKGGKDITSQVQVYHIVQPHGTASWPDLLTWLSATEKFETLPPREWVHRLDQLQQTRPEYPALKLLEVWRAAYATDENREDNGKVKRKEAPSSTEAEKEAGLAKGRRFDTSRARAVSSSLRDVRGVESEYFDKLWRWIRENVSE